MKSTIAHLNSQNFPRLRIGIGSPRQKSSDGEVVSHVLGRFSAVENQAMTEVLKLLVEAVELSIKQGIPKAMSLYNNRTVDLATNRSEA